MIKNLIILLSVCSISSSCSQVKQQSIANYFEELHLDKKFNGNVLILDSAEIVYKKSFGYAVGDKSEKLSDVHLFQIGSIYKEFPAVAIMQLKEKGLLAVSDKLSKFIPGLPEWSNEIGIEQLLQYSSGLPLVDWPSLFQENEKVSLDLVLAELAKIKKLNFAPGSDYLYSNYNPFLLIKIIESISESSFTEYLEQNIFTPYNIEGVVLTNSYPYVDSLTYEFAYPFNSDFEEDDLSYNLPTICSSTQGMQKWFSLLDNFQIISKESVQYLCEEAIRGDNIQAPLGRGDWDNGDLQLHLHHGSTGNYECLVRNYKANRIMIVLLTNQKNRNLDTIADTVYGMLAKTN